MNSVKKGEKHFTASAWIITKSNPKKVLLIHHKKLNRWIQPGGHIEKFENPVDAAVREIKEETGIDISSLLKEIDKTDEETSFLPLPEFFEEQKIPQYKDHPTHFHLDFQYLVFVKEKKLKGSREEMHNIGWFSKEEALKLQLHKNQKKILQKLLK